jgi:hypothetical protein
MVRGWAYYTDAIDSDPMLMIERKSKGYIAQEIDRILEQING